MPSGGHFAALEEPERLVADVRSFFRLVRFVSAAVALVTGASRGIGKRLCADLAAAGYDSSAPRARPPIIRASCLAPSRRPQSS
jgi:hypothetical protein